MRRPKRAPSPTPEIRDPIKNRRRRPLVKSGDAETRVASSRMPPPRLRADNERDQNRQPRAERGGRSERGEELLGGRVEPIRWVERGGKAEELFRPTRRDKRRLPPLQNRLCYLGLTPTAICNLLAIRPRCSGPDLRQSSTRPSRNLPPALFPMLCPSIPGIPDCRLLRYIRRTFRSGRNVRFASADDWAGVCANATFQSFTR